MISAVLPIISVIIPTLVKNKKYLDLCLGSFKANTQFNYEILIAENGKDTDYPQGQCQAVNRMAKKAQGDWLLISNDDMYYPPFWHKNLKFIADCFCPNLIEPTDNKGSAPPFLKLDAGLSQEEFKKEKVDQKMADHADNTVENGFNLPFFIKKELFFEIEGYDIAYDPWGSNSDSDLQYKLEIKGVTPKRLRGMLVYHFSNKSATFEPANQIYWQKNWEYFIEKWGFKREDTVWEHNLHIPLDKLKYQPSWSRYQ